MQNIELKVRVKDFKTIEKDLKKIGAKYQGVLKQKDTYYNCAKGRLKIREINNKKFELIFYQRPDKAINKLCDFLVVPIKKQELKQIKNLFALAMGVKVIVSKNRKLWLYKNTRVHLDNVDGLGKFLELETVLEKISQFVGQKEYTGIFDILKLDRFAKIKRSYSDLLLK